MNNKIYKTKKITQLAMLSAVASIIGIIDKIIASSIFTMLPGVKIGLANVIIIICIMQYKFKESILVVLLKIIIVSLLFGGVTTILIGGTASLISYLIMYYLYNINKLNLISISIIGGFVHINMQLIIIAILYNIGKELYLYGLLLISISFVTSIIVGVISNKIKKLKLKSDNNI